MHDILFLQLKQISILFFIVIFIIFSCVFFSQYVSFTSFLEDNVNYIVTIETDDCIEVINCIDIDFNYGSILSSPDDYYTLQIDDVTFRNIPKDVKFSYETVYEVSEPTFFEYIEGDYDEYR